MHTLEWADKTAASPLKLTLHGRSIYRAELGGSDVNPMTLRGHILLNINRDIIRIPHWIVFQEEDTGDVCIAPVHDHLVDDIMKDPSMFEQPVDLRSVYEMLSL